MFPKKPVAPGKKKENRRRGILDELEEKFRPYKPPIPAHAIPIPSPPKAEQLGPTPLSSLTRNTVVVNHFTCTNSFGGNEDWLPHRSHLNEINRTNSVLVSIGFMMHYEVGKHVLTRFSYAVWAPIDALIPENNHMTSQQIRQKMERWTLQCVREHEKRIYIQNWKDQGVKIQTPFGGTALGNFDDEAESNLTYATAPAGCAFSGMYTQSWQCSQVSQIGFRVSNVFTGEKRPNILVGDPAPNLGNHARLDGPNNETCYVQGLSFKWENIGGKGHGIKSIESATYLCGLYPLTRPLQSFRCCVEDPTVGVKPGTVEELRCQYQNGFLPKTQWPCKEALVPWCASNMTNPECKKVCQDPEVNCDDSLKTYCSKVLTELERANPGHGLEKLLADPELRPICSCSLPDPIYSTFFKDLQARIKTPGLPEYEECYFPSCAQNRKYLFLTKQGKGTVCPPVQSCTASLSIGNKGQIVGDLTAANVQNCFNVTGDVNDSVIPKPRIPEPTKPVVTKDELNRLIEEDRNKPSSPSGESILDIINEPSNDFPEDDTTPDLEDVDDDKDKKFLGLENWQLALGAIGIFAAVVLIIMLSRKKPK